MNIRAVLIVAMVAAGVGACTPAPPPVCDGSHQRALNPGKWAPPDDVAAPSPGTSFPSC